MKLSTLPNDLSCFKLDFVAEFADPDEKLTPEQCKQRVKATAIAMKALCLKIPNSKVRWAAEMSILELEEKAYECCNREHWTECLSPIVDAWKYLKERMDKGAQYAPYVLFPSSFLLEKTYSQSKGIEHV